MLIILPLLVGIAVLDGAMECARCTGDAERARCEGTRAIDCTFLQTVKISLSTYLQKERTRRKAVQAFGCASWTDLNEGCFSLAFVSAASTIHFRSVGSWHLWYFIGLLIEEAVKTFY